MQLHLLVDIIKKHSLTVFEISGQITFKRAVRVHQNSVHPQALQNSKVTCSKSKQSSVIIDIKASDWHVLYPFIFRIDVFLFEHMGHEELKKYPVADCIRYSFRFPFFMMQNKILVRLSPDRTIRVCPEIFEQKYLT